MIRRVFKLDDGQVLVTYDPATGVVYVATRHDDWDTWSHPLTQIRADDAVVHVGSRTYGHDGRTYGTPT